MSVLDLCVICVAMTFVGAVVSADLDLRVVADDLLSSRWSLISQARHSLESAGLSAIPLLLDVTNLDRKAPVLDTADTAFADHGPPSHGLYIPYFLHFPAARAGWILEEMVFIEFGFRVDFAWRDRAFAMVVFGRRNPSRSTDMVRLRTSDALQIKALHEANRRARAWWRGESGSWNRLQALMEALRSFDSGRHRLALQWLRYGRSAFPGMTRKYFYNEVLPLVKTLTKSRDDGVASDAKDLMFDKGQAALHLKGL